MWRIRPFQGSQESSSLPAECCYMVLRNAVPKEETYEIVNLPDNFLLLFRCSRWWRTSVEATGLWWLWSRACFGLSLCTWPRLTSTLHGVAVATWQSRSKNEDCWGGLVFALGFKAWYNCIDDCVSISSAVKGNISRGIGCGIGTIIISSGIYYLDSNNVQFASWTQPFKS